MDRIARQIRHVKIKEAQAKLCANDDRLIEQKRRQIAGRRRLFQLAELRTPLDYEAPINPNK